MTTRHKTMIGSSPMTKSRKFSAAQQIGTEEFFRLLKRAGVRATSMHEICHQHYSIMNAGRGEDGDGPSLAWIRKADCSSKGIRLDL